MTDCKKTSDFLADYINRKLTLEQNNKVVNHLAICQTCRNEAVALIRIRSLQQNNMVDVPQEIIKSAFKKIYHTSETLEDILNSNSYKIAFDLIRYTLTTVKQTIQLAQQAN